MSGLPSESWYGAQPAQQETQLRYTPLHRMPTAIWRRVKRATRVSPHTLTSLENKKGIWWFRIGLILFIWGIIGEAPFALYSGLSILIFTGAAWLLDHFSLYGLIYQRRFRIQEQDTVLNDNPRAFLGETLVLTLSVQNHKPIPLMNVAIEDSFPAMLNMAGVALDRNRSTNRKAFRSYWMPGALSTLTRTYTIPCTRRGYHQFGPAKLTLGDGIGLFGRTVIFETMQSLIVYPKLYTAADLHLPAKNPFGLRASEYRIFEDPLRTAGIREWQPSDSMQRIHWKATARHQDLLSRLYEPSEEAQIQLFLNAATLERYWEGVVPEMAEKAISVTATLAMLASEMRLPVGLIVNAYWPGSDQVFKAMPGRSPAQLTRLMEMLAVVDLPNKAIETQLLQEAPNLPWGATIVVITTVVYDSLLDALARLTRVGRKVVLFTLAPLPPERFIPRLTVYHLPDLEAGVVNPVEVQ